MKIEIHELKLILQYICKLQEIIEKKKIYIHACKGMIKE